MKLINSIKHQVILMFVAFGSGLSLTFVLLAIVFAFVVEDELINRWLTLESKYIETQYQQSNTLITPRLTFAQSFENKSDLPQFVQDALVNGIADNEIFTPDANHYHLKELQLAPNKTGYLLANVADFMVVTSSPQLLWLFAAGFILTLIVSIFCAIKLASLAVKPVLVMADSVKKKQPLPNLKYELGYLSDTMQRAFDDLSDSLKREKDFTTDLSHELRTPLTILNNTVMLAKQRGLSDDDINHLAHVGEQMQHTVEVLLALARAETIEQSNHLFKPLIEQIGMDCALAHNAPLDLQLNIDDDFKINANLALLTSLITNLINNAISHGTTNTLTVSATDNRLTFHNLSSNTAIDNIELKGVKGENSQGIGQGLYLVNRILETLGWDYQLKNSNGEFSVLISL